ncbi:MAG: alpha/beta fold hydrolase [Vicinamibacterales bacterium]
MQLAFLDPFLLSHHWQNAAALSSYVSGMSEQPDGGFDDEVYFAMLADLASLPAPELGGEARRTPVTVMFGERDPIVAPAAALASLQRHFEHLDVVTVATAGHAAHLEHPVSTVRVALGTAGVADHLRGAAV